MKRNKKIQKECILKSRMFSKNQGITLISLVVTIVILMILGGTSISMVINDNGLFGKAKEAKKAYEIANIKDKISLELLTKQLDENANLTEDQILTVLNEYGTVNYEEDGVTIKSLTTKNSGYEIAFTDIWQGEIIDAFDITNEVNKPELVTGMTAIKFTQPTESEMGEVVKTDESDENWYNYKRKKWANAQTEDGSMWVWIPRFAYKITGETIDVKFLIGQTDNYYIDENTIGTAQRQTSKDQVIDTTKDYTVHPAFTDESSIGYANGGWDSELTGIWVAKFEAGYASGNNDTKVVASNVNYTAAGVWVPDVEAGLNTSGTTSVTARNWLDGIYGGTTTSIKYPTFQGTTYSMNYINHIDSYNIARALTDNGNIYGFSNTNADSHMIKNSEWGALAYLSKSKYGKEDGKIAENNISLNSGNQERTSSEGKTGVDSVYAVTGCTTGSTNAGEKITTIEAINGITGNTASADGVYVWNQKKGQTASTTGTIYGVYDINGGTWERTSAYIANGNYTLKYAEAITYENGELKTESTKYTTVYPHDSNYDNESTAGTDTNRVTASQKNFASNTKIYGDAIRETTSSNAGTSNSSWNVSAWNSGYSVYPSVHFPFFMRGRRYGDCGGFFTFDGHTSQGLFEKGIRAIIIPII